MNLTVARAKSAARPAIPAAASGIRKRLPFAVFAAALACASPLRAQLSLTGAIDLALKASPRVKLAQDDLAKAVATLQGAHDLYIPSLSAGANLGQAYGYSAYPPTLFSGESQGLVYNASQFSYIRSARAGVDAANLSLQDARDAVAEDVAVTYAALLKDAARQAALHQQQDFARRLVEIVQERFDAGRDTAIDLTQSKLTLANFNLSLIHAEDDTLNDRTHMAALTDLPDASFQASGSIPDDFPPIDLPEEITPSTEFVSPGVRAAFLNATAKQFQAQGDDRFLYRPDVHLFVQYNRYATFTAAFKNLETQYRNIGSSEEVFGVQINIPLFDKFRQAKGRESLADAAHSLHDAENVRAQALDGQSRLAHSLRELRARVQVATLDQQLAQQQLDALLIELSRPPLPNRPTLTPKDEQNSRIAERDKHLAFIDATFQLRQSEINLLRQTGGLDDWLRQAATTTATPTITP